MYNSQKQSVIWLVVLILLITIISYATVILIPSTNSWLVNVATISCLVTGIVLLSIYSRIQIYEYTYPRWCIVFIAIVLSILCQLLFKYWQPLLIDLLGRQSYWSILAEPSRVYYLTGWSLIAILLIILANWLLLKLSKPFVVLGFYQLSTLPLLIGFSLWVIGLDSYQTPALLQSFSFDIANLLTINNNDLIIWINRGLLVAFILIKIIIALFYREKWLEQVQRLGWVAITIWLIMLLADMALTALKGLLTAYIGAIAVIAGYYGVLLIITVVIFQLFFRKRR